MRIGLLTSWRVPCGIYQYSARLADAFARLPDTEVVILAGRADQHRSTPEESKHEVHDVASIGLWRDDGTYGLDTDKIAGEYALDVVHVQYQSMLFRQPGLAALSRLLHGPFSSRNPRPLAITYHDNCLAPGFPTEAFDLRFSHRQGVGQHAEIIPFGVEDRPPVVRTFGLGRTRADLLAPVCARRGWVFEDGSSHEAIHGGGQHWKTHDELIAWLRGADAVVLWYDDVDAAGSSQAARTALASRRPVVVNDVTWFRDLPPRADGFAKVNNLTELEHTLEAVLERSYTSENSWDAVAQLLLERYSSAAASV